MWLNLEAEVSELFEGLQTHTIQARMQALWQAHTLWLARRRELYQLRLAHFRAKGREYAKRARAKEDKAKVSAARKARYQKNKARENEASKLWREKQKGKLDQIATKYGLATEP